MEIRPENLESKEVIDLLREHLRSMESTAPAESRHALDIDGLRSSNINFWSVWDGEHLAGFAALLRHNDDLAEIKSMRTATPYLRKGVASRILQHLIQEAKARGYSRLSLETGSMSYFEPARELYSSFGFEKAQPFGLYVEDCNSVFLTLNLKANRLT